MSRNENNINQNGFCNKRSKENFQIFIFSHQFNCKCQDLEDWFDCHNKK